jgi:magnesium chelatase family protein
VAMGALPQDALDNLLVLGELGLDGAVQPVDGVLSAALAAVAAWRDLLCPAACGSEAAWASDLDIIAVPSLTAMVNHFHGRQVLAAPRPQLGLCNITYPDMADLKGQDIARRVLEIAAVGGHNLLTVGPPGAGKSMLASRLAGLLPALTPAEALDVTMLHSIAGQLPGSGLVQTRPFRTPHHSASMAALVGGGIRARPGEISLAHHGVLFLDELAEFARPALDSLRQPLETGEVVVARANHHVTYPARFQLVAAMNPCRCGYLGDPARACSRAPACAKSYTGRISGPMLDRFDLVIDVPELPAQMLLDKRPAESTSTVAARVRQARDYARGRHAVPGSNNARLSPDEFEHAMVLSDEARHLLATALDRARLSARGYHKVLRVARTIADMAASDIITRPALAAALAYRAMPLLA